MHTCITFLTNVKKTNWDRCFRSIDKLCAALTISLFRLKVLRFFPCLGPFCASALHIPTCYIYRFARDMKARIHRLNFFFEFRDLSFSCLFKIQAKYLEKTIPSVK